MTRLSLFVALCACASNAAAEHATWLHGRWWRGTRSRGTVAALGKRLAAHDVRWVFPRAGFLRRSGGAPHAGRSARDLVRRLHRAAPGIKVLPWVIGFAHRHLGDGRSWIRLTARALARLIDRSGADGVHLDVEPPFGSFGQIPGRRLAALARAVRALRPRALISFAVHPLATPSFPRGLRRENLRPIIAEADQLVVMMYDTAIARRPRFVRAVTEQVDAMGRLAFGHRARLWMGAAAYPAHRARRWRSLHRVKIENVTTTTSALVRALATSPYASLWRGVGLFAAYSARERDWSDLDLSWSSLPFLRAPAHAPRR